MKDLEIQDSRTSTPSPRANPSGKSFLNPDIEGVLSLRITFEYQKMKRNVEESLGRDKRWYKMVKIPYMRNFLGKEERELEGGKKGIREEREMRDWGQKPTFLIFLPTQACWSTEGCARVWHGSRSFLPLYWEHFRVQDVVLEHAFALERKELHLNVVLRFLNLVFSSFFDLKYPLGQGFTHLFTFTKLMSPLTLLSINFKI